MKIVRRKPPFFNRVTAKASPNARVQVVELVGANSKGQASTFFGIRRTISEFFAKVLNFSLVIEIIGIFDFLQCNIMLVNSEVSPEFEIKIIVSPFNNSQITMIGLCWVDKNR